MQARMAAMRMTTAPDNRGEDGQERELHGHAEENSPYCRVS